MDQDIAHRISAPARDAPGPRYSLVWKLVFWPKGEEAGDGGDERGGDGDGDGDSGVADEQQQQQQPQKRRRGRPRASTTAARGAKKALPAAAIRAAGLSRPEWGPPQRVGSAAKEIGRQLAL